MLAMYILSDVSGKYVSTTGYINISTICQIWCGHRGVYNEFRKKSPIIIMVNIEVYLEYILNTIR